MLLSFVAFYLWLLKGFTQELSLRRDLRKLLVVFFLMFTTFLLASINSLDPIISIRHSILYCTLFLLAFVTIVAVKDLSQLTLLVKAMMLVGIPLSLYGIMEFVAPFTGLDVDKIFLGMLHSLPGPVSLSEEISPAERSAALFANANIYASYLTTVLPFYLCSLLYYHKIRIRNKTILFLGLFFITLTSFILTFSRSGALGLLAIIIALIFLKRRVVFSRRSLRLWVLLGIIVLVLIIQYGHFISPLLEARLTKDYAAKVHLFVAESAVRLFVSNPLTGIGLGNFGPAYGRYYKPGYEYFNAHSAYLTILSETGVFGFIIFALFLGYVLKQMLSFRKYSAGYAREVLADGLLIGFFGLMASNITCQTHTSQFLWVFLSLGFVAGMLVKNK